MACLDTSFVIDLLKDKREAVEIKERLEKSSESITLASPTIIELIRGLNSINVGIDEEDKIHSFINSVTTLALNKSCAIKSGYIELELLKKGEKIDLEDVMIAAIAITNNEKLITRNEKHFKKIKGLEVEGY